MKQKWNPFTTKKVTKEVEPVPYKTRKKKSRTTPPLLPHDQTAYFFYRRHRKTDNKIGEHRTRFKESVASIFEAISEVMTENEGGVYLEDYGYFAAMELKYIPREEILKTKKKRYQHLKGAQVNEKDFCLQLFSDVSPKSCIAYMSMDRSFSVNTRKYFAKQINDNRKKPKLYYTLLMSLYSRRKVKP